jgi:hypothetical protein
VGEEEFYLTVLNASNQSELEEGDLLIARTRQGEGLLLGRSSKADITLKDVSVSRRHARLVRADSQWELHNISSGNGVFIEGEEVAPGTSRTLSGLDTVRIQLGKVLLRLELARPTQPHTDPIALEPPATSPEASARPDHAGETLLRIVRDGDCCVVYCKGRRVGVKPSSALALYALGQRPGEIVHHWDIMDLIARDLDLPQAISGARRSIRELLDQGEITREEVIEAILSTNADIQRKQLEALDGAALARQLIFSRRGHGYGLALPAEQVECDDE